MGKTAGHLWRKSKVGVSFRGGAVRLRGKSTTEKKGNGKDIGAEKERIGEKKSMGQRED